MYGTSNDNGNQSSPTRKPNLEQLVNLKPLKLSNIHGAVELISSIPYMLTLQAVDMQPRANLRGGWENTHQGLPSYNKVQIDWLGWPAGIHSNPVFCRWLK